MLANCQFPTKETRVILPGPAGALETIIVGPENPDIKGIGIVCHPHPLYGGTMQNKVVTTVVSTFRDLGLAAVRFNFRGIGKSEGEYDDGVGEVQDLLTVVNWVKQQCPAKPIWLAGFSFGSFIAAKVATQEKETIAKLVLIAPPVNHFNFSQLPEFTSPTIVVQGDQDEVVPATEVYAWINHLKNPPVLLHFPTATHFFHGHLSKLRESLSLQLSK